MKEIIRFNIILCYCLFELAELSINEKHFLQLFEIYKCLLLIIMFIINYF